MRAKDGGRTKWVRKVLVQCGGVGGGVEGV